MPVTLTISSLEVLRGLYALAEEDPNVRFEKDGERVQASQLHYGDRITIGREAEPSIFA